MITQIEFNFTQEESERLILFAHSRGYVRTTHSRVWSDWERKRAIRYAIEVLVKDKLKQL